MTLKNKKKKTTKTRKRKGTEEEQAIRDRCTQLRSLLRRAWSKDPKRFSVKNDPNTKRAYNGANKRQKFEHKCVICGEWFPEKETQVDHINPCGSLLELTPECIGAFVFNLFEGALQKLCKPCHTAKTNKERSSE